MTWIQKGNRYLCAPYMVTWVKQASGRPPGFECWIPIKDRYLVLGRGLATLEKAQAFCAGDRARRAPVPA